MKNLFKKPQKKIEYWILESNSLISASQLNEKAKVGWELIQIILVDYTYYFYFKKVS